MMTVPETTGGVTQRLTRAERPGAPVGGEEEAGDDGGRAERPGRPDRPDSPGVAGSGRAMDSGDNKGRKEQVSSGDSAGGDEVYVTDTGEVVRVAKGKVTLSRRKRMGVRLATVAVFAVVLSVLVGFTGFALWQTFGGERVDIAAFEKAEFGYDPAINPFTTERATYMGVPIVGRTVVAIDGSYHGRKWLDMAKDAAEVTVEKSGTKAVQILIWNDEGGIVFPENIESITRGQKDKLREFLRGHSPIGQANLTGVVEKALVNKPHQLVLVTGQYLDEADIASAIKVLDEKAANVRVDVVMVSEDVPEELEKISSKRDGVSFNLSTRQMRDWYDEFLEAQLNDAK